MVATALIFEVHADDPISNALSKSYTTRAYLTRHSAWPAPSRRTVDEQCKDFLGRRFPCIPGHFDISTSLKERRKWEKVNNKHFLRFGLARNYAGWGLAFGRLFPLSESELASLDICQP